MLRFVTFCKEKKRYNNYGISCCFVFPLALLLTMRHEVVNAQAIVKSTRVNEVLRLIPKYLHKRETGDDREEEKVENKGNNED